MAYHHILLVVHLLAAAIWVGGHLLLLIAYVPKAIRERDKYMILNFESRYERLGMSALLFLIASGIAMAVNYGVMPGQWFHFGTAVERVVSLKLALLVITFLFALSAQLRVIPKLKAGSDRLGPLLFHIVAVTIVGVLMLFFGTFIRFGGL